MLKSYHIEICERALGNIFSPRALKTIIYANISQDKIWYQFRHPHFHFDSNAFKASYDFIKEQRKIVLELNRSTQDLLSGWRAFGRITHTIQDFYAHTNYIQLWMDAFPNDDIPAPQKVNALDAKTLQHPDLHSGYVYFWDWMAFIPGFYSLAHHMTSKDSHTHMNLDHPKRGLLFCYAFEAAVKRSIFEYLQISEMLGPERLALFRDL